MIYKLELVDADEDLSFSVLKQENQIPKNIKWKAVIMNISNWGIVDGNSGNHTGDLYYDGNTQTAYFETNVVLSENCAGLYFYALGGVNS